MKILVTGGTGFLGEHLVRALHGSGHEVVLLARTPTEVPEGVHVCVGDILNETSVVRAAEGCEALVHAAGLVSRRPEDAERLYQVHVVGTKTVLSACRKAGLRKAIVVSTSGTIAANRDPAHVATETDEPPTWLFSRFPYYRTKYYAERAAFEFSAADFAVMSANPSLLLGPGDTRGHSTEDVRLLLEEKVPVAPPGGLSFVDVRDVASCLVTMLSKGLSGRRYLLGAMNLTVRDFAERIARIAGVRPPLLSVPARGRLLRVAQTVSAELGRSLPFGVDPATLELASYFFYLDGTLAEVELGFSPRDPYETLADTIQDLRKRGAVWPASSPTKFSATP